MPPNRSSANSSPACASENDPDTATPIAQVKPTVPVTSLSSASPVSRDSWRLPKRNSLDSDVIAVASEEPIAAPIARQAASGIAGRSAWSEKPTDTITSSTRPVTSDAMPKRLRHSSEESTWRDSLKCSGAMNRMNRSSKSMPSESESGKANAMTAPRAIWTNGSDTPRTIWSSRLEATMATSRKRMSSSSSTAPPPLGFASVGKP